MLAPGDPARRVQFIDVRDLAAWSVELCERGRVGTFNAVAPAVPMGELLRECCAVTQSPARLVWCTDRELLKAGVQPWTGLPLWLPGDDPEFGGFQRASNARAVAAGLTFRPWASTLRDTFAWARAETALPPKQVAVLSPSREAEILASMGRSDNGHAEA
jgi:2'-hydroxyisoflavone reductase